MRVLKHGTIYKRNFKTECPSCNCVFKYKLKDIKRNEISIWVECPECRRKTFIYLEEKKCKI